MRDGYVEFTDRQQAGQKLAEKLSSYSRSGTLVIGLARGGVAVASHVAKALELPLDVLVVKKIPSIANAELAVGALAPDGVSYVDWRLAHRTGADEQYVNRKIEELGAVIDKKSLEYRKGRKPLTVRDKQVIVIDDGAATGATIEAAIRWIRKKHAKKVIIALPVVARDTVEKIRPEAEELVTVFVPDTFDSVGQFYKTFPQVEDAEVIDLLKSGE